MYKKTVLLITVFSMMLLTSIPKVFAAKTTRLSLNPRVHCLDQAKRGNFVWTQLQKRKRYKVTISGKAYFGNQEAKGIFVYFTNNKEDTYAERYLFVKPGDYFYINTRGGRPFLLAFFMKFYGNRRTYKGRINITLTILGKAIHQSKYRESDMYRGIRP